MAILEEVRTGRRARLLPSSRVGREGGAVVVEHDAVSLDHALLRWTGAAWELRDLNSRNGTWVDGAALGAAQAVLGEGSRVAFGRPDLEWVLVDASAPRSCAEALDDGALVEAEGGFLEIPGPEGLAGSAFTDDEDRWILASGADERPVRHGDVVVVGGRPWRLHLVTQVVETRTVLDVEPRCLQDASLVLAVSQDREHIEGRLVFPDGEVDLGARRYLFLLHHLAEVRLADRASGVAVSERGWVYHDQLARDLGVSDGLLFKHVHDARKAMVQAGAVDGGQVIERRMDRRLRLGMASVVVRSA